MGLVKLPAQNIKMATNAPTLNITFVSFSVYISSFPNTHFGWERVPGGRACAALGSAFGGTHSARGPLQDVTNAIITL